MIYQDFSDIPKALKGIMKILAVADVHGKSEKLRLIKEQIRSHKPDGLIIAGDVINYFKGAGFIKELSQLPLPIYAIRGNSDPSSVEREMAKYAAITNLHLNEIKIRDVPFIGINGTVPLPFHSKIRFFESSLLNRLKDKLTSDSVLVAHPPPKGSVDKVFGKYHAGSKGLAKLIEEVQPRLVICGHIHEDVGTATMEKTVIINCSVGARGRGVLIELSDTGRASIKIL
ncbi:metallophosphoesterase family protein [bacterium]|nr:metallophosphoesterase family protein [bacterium]